MSFLFHFGAGVFYGDGEASGTHGGQIDDVIADEGGFFWLQPCLLHDLIETGPLILHALIYIFEFQVARTECDCFRNALGDKSGLDAAEPG